MDRPTSVWLLVMSFALLGSAALYSCVPHIEEELHVASVAALGAAAAPVGWASVEVDGQRLVVTGTAPDASERTRVLTRLEGIDGVVTIDNQTLLKPAVGAGNELDIDMVMRSGASTADPVAAGAPPVTVASAGVAMPASAGDPPQSAVGVQSTDGGPAAVPLAPTAEGAAGDVADRIDVPPAAVPEDLPPVLAACQARVNALLAGSGTFFASGSADVEADALPTVDRIAGELEQCDAGFEIAGHTDNSGRTRPNQRLSQARADAIRARMIEAGIAASRVSAVGYGESVPLVSNRTPEGRKVNRRIEIKVHKPATVVAPGDNPT